MCLKQTHHFHLPSCCVMWCIPNHSQRAVGQILSTPPNSDTDLWLSAACNLPYSIITMYSHDALLFTPTAADVSFYMETCFPTLSYDNQTLSSSGHSARGQFKFWKPVGDGQLYDHRKTHYKKIPIPKLFK